MNKSFRLVPTPTAATFPESLWEALLDQGFNFGPKDENDGFPMPWDAGFEIYPKVVGDHHEITMVISGSAGPSGFGDAKVSIPLSSAADNLKFEVYDLTDNQIAALVALGYNVVD